MFFLDAVSRLMGRFATTQRGGSPQRRTSRPRPRPLSLEPLEDRLCLSVDLLVGSNTSHRVMRYDGMTGDFIDIFAKGNGLFSPTGLAYGADDNLYVSSQANNRILRYDGMTGDFIDTFVPAGSGGLNGPNGLTVGPDGHFYVSSRNNHRILRFDATTGDPLPAAGQEEAIFVPPGSGGLSSPRGLVFGPDHNLYVSSFNTDSILRYNGTTGQFMDTFVSDPGARFTALVFGPDGNLYVSSGQGYGSSVRRYEGTSGAFIDAFTSEFLDLPSGLAFGPDGNLYVSSTNHGRVVRFDGTTGAFIDVFVATGSGGLLNPDYLTFHDFGNESGPGHGGPTSSQADPVVAFQLAGTTLEVAGTRVDVVGLRFRTSLEIVTFGPISVHDAIQKPPRLVADQAADQLSLSQPTLNAWGIRAGLDVLDRVFANAAESAFVEAPMNDLSLAV